MIMTNREQLLYALKVQRLHEIFVLKDDIHLQYKYKNINRARNQAATFQDKIIDAVIEDAVTGTSDPISSSTIKNNVEKIIDTNLRNDTKRISHDIPKKAVEAAVSNISNRYQFILGNRIREEIPNLQGKIEDYINSKDLGKLPEADLTEKLKAEYGTHAQKRIQNIIKDSFHTNECNLSWVKAVYDGYQYKSWNNGRTKRTRVWHKAKFIQSVPIDETFDIFGSYPARMMYPGDLNGGAENVANCRCWLSYSNRPPSDLRGSGKKTTTKYSKNKSNSSSKKSNNVMNKIKEAIKKPVSKVKSKLPKSMETETKTTINNNTQRIINTIKSKIKEKEVKKIMKNYHDYTGVQNLFDYLKHIYPEPNLSKGEIKVIAQWVMDSKLFNDYFDKKMDGYYENIKMLNSIIDKYPNIKGNVMLHRYSHEDFFLVDVGKLGIFNRFISTSFTSDKSTQHGEYHTIILAPKGTNGAFIEETLRNFDGNKHLMEEILVYDIEYETLYMNYQTKTAIIQIK